MPWGGAVAEHHFSVPPRLPPSALQGDLALLLHRPPKMGPLGAALDLLCVLMGTRAALAAVFTLLLHQPPLAVLVQQGWITLMSSATADYCRRVETKRAGRARRGRVLSSQASQLLRLRPLCFRLRWLKRDAGRRCLLPPAGVQVRAAGAPHLRCTHVGTVARSGGGLEGRPPLLLPARHHTWCAAAPLLRGRQLLLSRGMDPAQCPL